VSVRHPEGELVAYARGELAPADHARIDAHLAACAGCREAVSDFRVLRDHVAAATAAAPEPLWTRYRAEVRARLAADTRRRRWLPAVPVAVAATVAGIALVTTLQLAGRAPAPNGEGIVLEDVALAGRLDLLQQYPIVERLDLLEDLDVIRNLDRLAGTREG
jgi:anti-sigma factor RsiW